jgi:hypothetical protein
MYRQRTRSRSTERSPATRLALRVLLGLVLAHALRAPVAAQQAAACPGGRISGVLIENHSVFDLTQPRASGRLAWAYSLANRLHMQTRPEVVERELLFEVGDCYDVELLRDSERLLRGFDFLADANVYGVRQPDGSVMVIVDTQDEWSARIEPRVESRGGVRLQGLRLVEDNLAGTGRHMGLFFDREEEERIFGFSYSTPHLFRSRWNMGLHLARTEFGYSYREAVIYPFLGETGRFAFRQSVDREDRYFELLMPVADELARIWVPVRREGFEIGSAIRWGGPRFRQTLLGVALAGERIGFPEEPHFVEGPVRGQSAGGAIDHVWFPGSSVRMMLLTGQRNVYFARRHGLDTVNGTEDVQFGVEAELTLGPTLPVLSDERDIALGLGFFAAGELAPEALVGGQFAFEGRRSYRTIGPLPEWNDVLAELDAWAYLRGSADSRNTVVAAFSAVGGWHGRAPFQLTLGGDAGLRGHARHVDPGGRRIVGSLEHRSYLAWPLPELFDLGTVVFVDAGRIWTGHVPFGTDSPVRSSAGVGLRAAFPPGSRQTLRVDLGLPVQRRLGWGDLVVSIGVGQSIGRQAIRRDPQLLRSARYNLSSSDFIFPTVRP